MNVSVTKNDKLYDNISNMVLHEPGILVAPESDIILKYGEMSDILAYQGRTAKATLIMPTVAITLSGLNVKQQAYVINRMMNYTQTGFIRNFVANFVSDDFNSWLEQEMYEVPLKVA